MCYTEKNHNITQDVFKIQDMPVILDFDENKKKTQFHEMVLIKVARVLILHQMSKTTELYEIS